MGVHCAQLRCLLVVVIENVMNSLRVLMSTLPECALFAIRRALLTVQAAFHDVINQQRQQPPSRAEQRKNKRS